VALLFFSIKIDKFFFQRFYDINKQTMSVSKAEFVALVARVTALEAEIRALKEAKPSAPSKKEKKEKKAPNAAQVLNKKWIEHCLEKYPYPSEMKEAEEKKLSESGKKDGLLIHRNNVAFAKSMQSTHVSDYESFKLAHAPAPAEEESATESATESAASEKKRGRKSKESPAAAPAPAAASAEEEAVPVPAPGGRKVVVKKGKKE